MNVMVRSCVPGGQRDLEVDVVATITRDGSREHTLYLNRGKRFAAPVLGLADNQHATLIAGDDLMDWLAGRGGPEVWGR